MNDQQSFTCSINPTSMERLHSNDLTHPLRKLQPIMMESKIHLYVAYFTHGLSEGIAIIHIFKPHVRIKW